MCCPLLQGSATLSMAYAAALFADSVLHGLNGECSCLLVKCFFYAPRPVFAPWPVFAVAKFAVGGILYQKPVSGVCTAVIRRITMHTATHRALCKKHLATRLSFVLPQGLPYMPKPRHPPSVLTPCTATCSWLALDNNPFAFYPLFL